MKRVSLLFTSFLMIVLSQAQSPAAGSWKITWNNKVLLETSKSDEAANVRTIKSSDLAKKYVLELTFREGDAKQEKEWIRSFMIMDEADKEIMRKDSTRHFKITAAELKKLFGDKTKIKIYTIAIPSDPALAARVRVRRVHLCTLQLK